MVILDDLSTGRRENIVHLLDSGGAVFVDGSVLDAELVDEWVERTDSCFHLASAVGVKLVVDSPLESLLRNVRGADVVAHAAAHYGRRLLFTSTSEVYGKHSNGALRRDSDCLLGPSSKSRWGYATTKAFGEMLAFGYARERDARTVVVRLFNSVGPRQLGSYGMVLPRFVSQALKGDDLTVYGDGTQSRCFTHVYDTVEAIVAVAESERAVGGAFNVGATREITIQRLAERVIERTGSSSRIRHVPYREAYGEGFEELGSRKPDTSAIEQLCGWRPRRTIDDAIDDLAIQMRAAVVREREASGRALLGRPGGGRRALHIGEMLGGDEIRIAGAVLTAFLVTLLATPVAWRVAVRTAFFDHPVGYKEHSHPTRYLGGAAVMAGVLAGTVIFGAAADYKRMLAAAADLCDRHLDDRIQLGVTLRLLTQVATGGRALGRRPRLDDAASAPREPGADHHLGRRDHQRLQPDGQSRRSGGDGWGRLQRGHPHAGPDPGAVPLAVIAFSVTGPALASCLQPRQAGEDLPRRRGSMPIGLLVACMIMAIPDGQLDWTLLFATAPLVGLPILDTTLVVVSASGEGSGAERRRDHLTHRLLGMVGSERKVA